MEKEVIRYVPPRSFSVGRSSVRETRGLELDTDTDVPGEDKTPLPDRLGGLSRAPVEVPSLVESHTSFPEGVKCPPVLKSLPSGAGPHIGRWVRRGGTCCVLCRRSLGDGRSQTIPSGRLGGDDLLTRSFKRNFGPVLT